MSQTALQAMIFRIARRQRTLALAVSIGWLAAAGIWISIALHGADASFSIAPFVTKVLCCGIGVTGIILAGRSIGRALRPFKPHSIARRLDELAGSGSQIQSGVDLSFFPDPGLQSERNPITVALLRLSTDRATRLAGSVRLRRVVPMRVAAVPACIMAAGIAVMLMPLPVRSQAPLPTPRQVAIALAPRHQDVLPPQTLPADPAPTVASTDSVPSGLLNLPHVRDVHCRITSPSADKTSYDGPLPAAGISAVAGSTVNIWANCTCAVGGGMIQFTPSDSLDAAASGGMVFEPDVEPMMLTDATRRQVTGSFVVGGPGRLQIQVSDTMGMPLPDVIVSPVMLASGPPPTVRIVQPASAVFASPNEIIILDVVADDDAGVAGLMLCRSLNGVVAPPLEIPIAPPAPHCPLRIVIRLSDWKLSSGDIVKLFVRAQDITPNTPQHADSAVITINITAA